ncbi:hypothetical protein C8Q77DRAFT_1103517 [Trametes polyzona]|nr:hypothetical protein C8Q77DRAFT_1103517 [Trametes polyzona]
MDVEQQQSLTPQERVPAEIWLEILELVPATADLYCLSVTCRKFHGLATRALHRNVIWTKPVHVARSLPVWEAMPGMDAAVRSLELGVTSYIPGTSIPMVDLEGAFQAWRGPARPHRLQDTFEYYRMTSEERGGFASPALDSAMFARIYTFKNMSSLAFTNMLITNKHLHLVHQLPQLRSLRLELCLYDGGRGAPPLPKHTDLPITELTILNLRRCIATIFFNQVQFDEAITPVLTLCTARNLHTLTVDSSADVFRQVFGAWDATARGWTVPDSLQHVYILRRRLFDGEVQPMYSGESNFPESHLYHFVVQASDLRTVSTPLFVPQNVTIAPEALPWNLDRFAAPVETAMLIAGVRKLEALGVLKCGLGSREAILSLENIAMNRPDLKMLLVELRAWDSEVITAIGDLFRNLRRLRVVYEGARGPTEDFLVTLGPEFLAHMPHLHTLQLYAQPMTSGWKPEYPRMLYDDSFESIEEELMNLVIPYNRYCPNLRKVQFCAGYTVSRSWAGAAWSVERVRRLEEKDDLSF